MQPPDPGSLWHIVTRIGEAQILLPAAALTLLALLPHAENRLLSLRWLVLVSLATAFTVVSKVAFLGWGIGWAATNFTGISATSPRI